MQKTEDLIALAIEDYFKQHPNATERSLSEKTNYNRSSLRSLRKKEYDKSRLDIISLKKFLSYILGSESVSNEIISSDPVLKKNMEDNFSYINKILRQNQNESSARIDFSDKNRSLCIILASIKSGISKDEIQSMLADDGVRVLEELEREEIIRLDENNKYVPYEYDKNKNDTVLTFNRKEVQSLIRILIDFYRPQHAGQGINFIGVAYQRWNKKFYKEVQGILQEAHLKIAERANLEENMGDIPGFACLFLDRFTLNQEENK